ncbi:unnamed protein product [marine sediment metagenome]|uniref:Uncharacterized protein n=1 Tax=marine sediment metagenome TaxID=412755 RepID=X1RMS1_9ZZZZ
MDVRAAHTEKELGQTIRDYARYSGRPANLIDIPAEHRLEVVQAFEGIRVCWKTGICKAVSLSPPKYDKGDSEKRNLGRDITVHRIAASGNMDALKIAFHALAKIPLENARSFRADDNGYDSAGILSPVEPLPKDLFSANERSPPGENACHYEGDVSAKNVPW